MKPVASWLFQNYIGQNSVPNPFSLGNTFVSAFFKDFLEIM